MNKHRKFLCSYNLWSPILLIQSQNNLAMTNKFKQGKSLFLRMFITPRRCMSIGTNAKRTHFVLRTLLTTILPWIDIQIIVTGYEWIQEIRCCPGHQIGTTDT